MKSKTSDKLCECGCGEFTKIARDTIERWGYVRGEPMRFVQGHAQRRIRNDDPSLCACGCGQFANVNEGKAKKFVHGHNSQIRVLSESDYTIEDRGYETPCWIWSHCRGNKPGHGRVTIRKRKMWAHRAMYEQLIGPIPTGLVLDHLCCNPPCVNPDHLEPVTQGVNVRRWMAKHRGFTGSLDP